MAALVAGDPAERVGASRVLLDGRQRVVQDDGVALELEVVEAVLDVDRGHATHRRPSPPRRLPCVSDLDRPPPLRYLAAADVLAAMPDLDERLRLAELTLTALVADAELPPKIGVHPRRPGRSPTRCRPSCAARIRRGGDDLLGMKWVAGLRRPTTTSACRRSTPWSSSTTPATGLPIAILDGGPITALRTAAVSGVAIRRFAPAVTGRAPRAALIGAGVQGRSHLAVLGAASCRALR